MPQIKLFFGVLPLLLLSLFVLISPADTHAVQSVYTIQAGSFSEEASARSRFDAMVEALMEKDLQNLRIEKIGKYYSVRLGKFEKNEDAKKLLTIIRPDFPAALIMSAYYKEERILKSYKSTPAAGIKEEEEKPPSAGLPTETKPATAPPVPILREKAPIKPVKKAETTPKGDKSPSAEQSAEAKPATAQPVPVLREKAPIQPVKKAEITSLEERIKQISDLVLKKEYQGALKAVQSGIGERPESHELNGWYGAVLLKTDQPSKAIEFFQKASKLSPQVSDYYNGTGYSLLFLNRFDEAISEFKMALDIEPAHVDALTGLGTAYTKTGNKDKASEVYQKLLKLDSTTAEKLGDFIKSES